MKVVIWILCILVYSVLQTVLRGQGIILGGVPTVLLALVLVFLPAPAICKAWDKHKAKKVAIPPERWYTCQKCGQLVREGEKCDCEQVAPAQEEQPEVAEKKGGWQRILPYIGCLLLAVFFVISLLAAVRNNREPEICVRCSSEEELTANCPCCSAPICQSCLADIEYEHSAIEKSGYSSGFEDGYSEAEPSFAQWAVAKSEAEADWKTLRDAGYISLSFDEWWVFVQGTYLAGE